MSAQASSGAQTELVSGEQRAVVVEVGGGLRCYRGGEREILDGYASRELCDGARGQPLLPWPNRISEGRYEWEGETHQLEVSEPALGNAIHGLTRWRNWHLSDGSTPTRATLEHTLHPSPGYPFALALAISYELDEDTGLTVTTRATNVGPGACPYGVGFHPYLRLAGSPQIDAGLLTLPAATRLVADDHAIPRSRVTVAGSDHDFRAGRAIGDLAIDSCFTDLERDPDGLARVTLEHHATGARTTVWLDAAYRYVMVFTGDTLAPGRRRRGLAIEPMSCAPNALQSGDGLIRLEPGDSHTARWGITPHSPPRARPGPHAAPLAFAGPTPHADRAQASAAD